MASKNLLPNLYFYFTSLNQRLQFSSSSGRDAGLWDIRCAIKTRLQGLLSFSLMLTEVMLDKTSNNYITSTMYKLIFINAPRVMCLTSLALGKRFYFWLVKSHLKWYYTSKIHILDARVHSAYCIACNLGCNFL